MSNKTAIFLNGPAALRVMAFRGDPPIIHVATAEASRGLAGFVITDEPSEPVLIRKSFYSRLALPLPFDYAAYVLDGTETTDRHVQVALQMVEFLVREGHAKTTESLATGYRETTALLTRRLEGLEQKVSGLIANHNLTWVNDDTTQEDYEDYE